MYISWERMFHEVNVSFWRAGGFFSTLMIFVRTKWKELPLNLSHCWVKETSFALFLQFIDFSYLFFGLFLNGQSFFSFWDSGVWKLCLREGVFLSRKAGIRICNILPGNQLAADIDFFPYRNSSSHFSRSLGCPLLCHWSKQCDWVGQGFFGNSVLLQISDRQSTSYLPILVDLWVSL